jgi:beta-lactamase class A
VIAWAARHLPSGRAASRNGDVLFPSASTIKLLISTAFWLEVDAGRLDPRERVRAGDCPAPGGGGLLESLDAATAPTLADLDLLMLAVSDNAATNVLIERVGGACVNDLAGRLELRGTELRRAMGDEAARARGIENTTCADDLVRLLTALALPGRIPRPVARRVIAAAAQSHHTDIVPRLLPAAEVRSIASKQGGLDTVRHDAALIDEADGRVAVAVLSSPPGAQQALAQIAAFAFAAVAGPAK